jgi:hypothetical protein
VSKHQIQNYALVSNISRPALPRRLRAYLSSRCQATDLAKSQQSVGSAVQKKQEEKGKNQHGSFWQSDALCSFVVTQLFCPHKRPQAWMFYDL